MAETPRILLNTAELRALIAGKAIAYTIRSPRFELALGHPINARAVIIAALDRMDGDLNMNPPDPAEAREFLPRGNARKGR